MRIKKIETFSADGGFTRYHFLKITAENGQAGWAEYGDGAPSLGGLAQLIGKMAPRIIGQDARAVRRISTDLYSATRFAAGGLNAQAIGAIQNACLDLKAKGLGVPVHDMLGGALREQIPVYWSHCGMYRAGRPALAQSMGLAPIASLDDVRAMGERVRDAGYTALKCNLMRFDANGGVVEHPGFRPGGAGPALSGSAALEREVRLLMQAFRSGAGDGVELILDANFNFRTDGFLRLARAVQDIGLRWLEMDLLDPAALASIRRATSTPIGSLEAILGTRAFAPFIEAQAVDVAIIDVMWNGLLESLSMATLAEAHEISVAPHNYAGPLATVIGAHLAMLIPNLALMEYDVEAAPVRDRLLTNNPVVAQGWYQPPDGPGWGCEPDEAQLTRHTMDHS